MKRPTCVFLILAACLSGCITQTPEEKAEFDRAMERVYQSMRAPVADMVTLKSGSLDLLYDTASFLNRNRRWPANYTELTNFVASSGGYLWLAPYERVEFKSLTNDCVEIVYVRPGQTKENKFTIGDVPHAR